MQNFSDTFEKCKQLFTSAFSICLAVLWWPIAANKKKIKIKINKITK